MNKKDIVFSVNIWACEATKAEETSILGYPSQSSEQAFVVDGGKMPDFCPEIRMSKTAMAVDRAVRDMPDDMRNAIFVVHIVPGGVNANMPSYKSHYECSTATFYKKLDSAYWFVAGYLKNK